MPAPAWMDTTMDRLADLRTRTPAMLRDLQALVEAESPSADPALTAGCAEIVRGIGDKLLRATADLVVVDGRTHVLWRIGDATRVLLIGHLDTVWPAGTLDRWPFTIEGDRATGPGVFDMKSGIVQGLHALSTLDDLNGVTVLITSDEELGSQSSSALIEDLARGAHASLILEPASGGALKTGRKGVTMYKVEIEGRAAHAGLEPEKGASALEELAHQVLGFRAMEDRVAGTTVTPTLARAGTAVNVVPASATVEVDVRALTIAEQQRIHGLMQKLAPHVEGTTLRVEGEPNRPPLEEAASADLFARASRIADGLGLQPLRGVTVGGASDGNFTAALGCPTLDGLGGVGAGAHAEGEHIIVSEMATRACLVASLVDDLLRGTPR